jgi:hypothetical protein
MALLQKASDDQHFLPRECRREPVMKKLLFACAMSVAGAFAFTGASPASAMSAGPVTGLSDIVTSSAAAENVGYYYRRGFCGRYPWRCRRGFYGPRYRYYAPRYRYYHRPWWW